MDRMDRGVATVLVAGVLLILLGILVVALRTRLPVSHLYIDAAGARVLQRADVDAQLAPDWPGAYRVNAQSTNAAFGSQATIHFASGKSASLPRRDVLLWVYRG